jgi:hypothetical protein
VVDSWVDGSSRHPSTCCICWQPMADHTHFPLSQWAQKCYTDGVSSVIVAEIMRQLTVWQKPLKEFWHTISCTKCSRRYWIQDKRICPIDAWFILYLRIKKLRLVLGMHTYCYSILHCTTP